ncbi:hypothetical protein PZB74_18150 [Porifericola rhodea]|uniref:hypothetical protein n=1 Tax=Porifericola rhodea TaxID=930972 RepID=UPI0026669144|nr:hypothetical protein [Porifericola rhodea]WKN30879.1 hypothetical protein PZB74_18150 [Porifericola rhodea]
MKKEDLQHLSDEELRQAFRKHNINGIVISLSLMAVFFILYLVPLGIGEVVLYSLFTVLVAASAIFGLWYNFSKRKYYREFRNRQSSI